jgi:hypothetical protein
MATLTGFNAAEVEPAKGFEPLPSADYTVIITESEMKATSAGTGNYLALTIEVMDGQYKSRKLFHNLNLDNPNAEAVRIAKAELSAICRAVKVLTPKDSVELHNIPFVVKVGIEKRKDTGDLQNRIKAFKPKEGTAPAVAGSTGGAAPWQKKTG